MMTGEYLFASNRLTYRPVAVSDARALFDLDNDPAVMRWINGGEKIVFADFYRDQMPVYLQPQSIDSFGFLVIEHDQNFVGWISLRPTANAGEASLGYRLKQAYWGRGFASEAARTLIERAFFEESPQTLSRIVANTYEENVGSRRVLEKAGMTLVRREQPNPEDLAGLDTAVSSGEVWEGDECYYAIARDSVRSGRV